MTDTQTPSQDNTDNLHRWMVHYEDGALEPIGIAATDRHTARRIGRDARDARVAAAVREDEGEDGLTEEFDINELSTTEDPYRFIHSVLS